MKRTIAILFLAAAQIALLASPTMPWLKNARGPSGAGAPAPTYLINQNFEGTGFDNGETWTKTGTWNEDYTTAPLVGSQSLISGDFGASIDSPSFTGQSTVWVFARIKNSGSYWTQNGTERPILSIKDSGGTTLAALKIIYTGGGGEPAGVYLEANGGNSDASASTLTNGTEYYFWLKFVSGGTCELYASASSTRPTVDGSGNVVLTKTGASGTASKVTLQVVGSDHLIFDRVLVSSNEIGSNP